MMCQSTGLPPISTIGFGRRSVSSLILVPMPPAKMTTFILTQLSANRRRLLERYDRHAPNRKRYGERFANRARAIFQSPPTLATSVAAHRRQLEEGGFA